MYASVLARTFLDAWRSFCRGVGADRPLSVRDLILAEYSVEALGRRSYDKTIGDYFKSGGKPEMLEFAASIGCKLVNTPDALAAQALYTKLATDLYVADYPLPTANFLTGLEAVAKAWLPIVDECIKQCVQYNGRNWHYFKRVAEQASAIESAKTYAEEKELGGMRLEPDYFERLSAQHILDPHTAHQAAIEALESAKDDKLMGHHAETND